MISEELYSRQSLAKKWGVSLRTIDRLRLDRRLPWIDLASGKGARPIVRFRLSDIEDYERDALLNEKEAL